MTRDILVILVYVVSSKSAFSIDGRILDSFRSSSSSTIVEAPICAQNWLRSNKQNVDDLEVEINEAEKIESGVSSFISIFIFV